MKRGPESGQSTVDHVARARAAWDPAPDWVLALAEEATRRGLKAAGERIGYGASTVSQVLSRSYAGDTGRVAEAVRGALMGSQVHCPALGQDLRRDVCLGHQRAPLSTASPQSVRLYRACRGGCPNASTGEAS